MVETPYFIGNTSDTTRDSLDTVYRAAVEKNNPALTVFQERGFTTNATRILRNEADNIFF